jgi:DNA cross-link repair 1A protein
LKRFTKTLKLNKNYKIAGRTVTLLKANHCPGATMIIFQSKKGVVLHTGDFRYIPSMIPEIQKVIQGKKIDYIHIDNTFGTDAESFPSQIESYKKLVNTIVTAKKAYDDRPVELKGKKKVKKPPLKIFVYFYTLGKEELLDALAR